MSTTREILDEREKTHGSYANHASMTQKIMRLWQTPGFNWHKLNDMQSEALHMIAHKVARILCGDPNHEDHWRDISGYAQLVADGLPHGQEEKMGSPADGGHHSRQMDG